MKATKPSYNSFRRLLNIKDSKDIGKGNEMGRTILPAGSEESTVRLPSVENTVTYSVLKTSLMEDKLNIVNDSVRGSLKGLLLNDDGGTLSIQSVGFPTQKFAMSAASPEGAEMDFLSNGRDWFFWGFLANGDIEKSAIGDFGGDKDTNRNTIPDWIDQHLRDSGVDTENLTPENAESFTEQVYEAFGPGPGGTGGEEGTGAPLAIPPSPPAVLASESFPPAGSTLEGPTWPVGGEGAVPGSTVVVSFYDDQGIVESQETVVVDSDGNWSVEADVSDWADGNHFAGVTITNPNTGLTSPEETIDVVIDTTPPVATLNGGTEYGFLAGQAPADPGLSTEPDATWTSTWDVDALNDLAPGQQATITYTITDPSGNVATLTRTVIATSYAEGNIPLAPPSGPATYVDGVFSSNGATYTHDGITLDDNLTVFSFWFRNDDVNNQAAVNLLYSSPDDPYSTGRTNIFVGPTGFTLDGVLRRVETNVAIPIDTSTLNPPINIMDGEWHHLVLVASKNYANNNETYRVWVAVDGESSEFTYGYSAADLIPLQGNGGTGGVGNLRIGESGRSISLSQFEILEGVNPSPDQVTYTYNNGIFGKLIQDGIDNQQDERLEYYTIVESFEESGPFSDRTSLANIVDESGDLVVHGIIEGSNGYKYDPFHYDPSKMEGRTYSAWFYIDAPLPAGSFKTIIGKYGWYSGTSSFQNIGGWTFGVTKDSVSNQDALQFRMRLGRNNNTGIALQVEHVLASNFVAGQWYHVAVSYSLGNCVIYLNGVPVVSDSSTFTPSFYNIKTPSDNTSSEGSLANNVSRVVHFAVGATNSSAFNGALNVNPFDFGKINQIGVYYGVMSDQDILDLYNSQNTNP